MASLLFCPTHRAHTEKHGPVGSAYWSDDYQGLLFIVFKEVSCAHWLSVALIKHQYQKQFEEEKDLFELTAHYSPLWREAKADLWGRSLSAGIQADPWGVLLTVYSPGSCSFLILPGPFAQGWRQPQGAGPPTSILNHENASLTCFQAGLTVPLLQWSWLVSDWFDKLAHQHKAKCLLHFFF